MKRAANPPMRAIAYPMSLTNTETRRESPNHTKVCIILRFFSCISATAGDILRNARYRPSIQLLQDIECKLMLHVGLISIILFKYHVILVMVAWMK